MALKAAKEADAILNQVSEQSNAVYTANRKAAIQYVLKLRDSLNNYSKIGTDRVDSVVQDNIRNITEELNNLQTTIKDVSNGLVDIALSQINKILATVESTDPQKFSIELEEAVTETVNEVEAMWNGLDQSGQLYTTYWSELIEKKVQNMTESVSHLVNTHSRSFNGTVEDHVGICHNISQANVQTSNIIQTMVQLMDSLYTTTRVVGNLQSVYLDGDQHASNVIQESQSLLLKYQQNCKGILDTLMDNQICFLGSAVFISAKDMCASLKGYILHSWKVSLGHAIKAFKLTTANYLVIPGDHQDRVIAPVKASLDRFREEIRNRATVFGANEQDRISDRVSFMDLNDFMDKRFRNLTEIVNSEFTSSLASMGEALRFHIEFQVNEKLPYRPILTIQNYVPVDVCPLAMDFQNYIKNFVNEADELREILSVGDGMLADEKQVNGVAD